MAKHLVIAVDWYGPYHGIETAHDALRADFDSSGLYFALGRGAEGMPIIPMYVGISRSLQTRVSSSHETLSTIDDLRLWIGEVGTARPSGKSLKKTPPTLDYAEWLTAYFQGLPLNVMKRTSIPDVAVTLLNRWWKIDYETPHVRRPHAAWPDLIDYLGHDYPTKIVWFGGKMQRVPARRQS